MTYNIKMNCDNLAMLQIAYTMVRYHNTHSVIQYKKIGLQIMKVSVCASVRSVKRDRASGVAYR